jgi:glycosyltransferase involved in cell wall biosynthesis
VALNRRLANEMARVGSQQWEVTAVAPRRFRGDLRRIQLEGDPREACSVVPVNAFLTRKAQLFVYGSELVPLIREGTWDLLHLWEEPFVFAAAEVTSLARRSLPLIFATYQNIEKRYPPPFDLIERYVVRRAAGWIAGGELIARTMNKRPGYPARPMSVIPMGVDTDAFRPDADRRRGVRSRLGWPDEGPPVIGYLGRFVHEKGLLLLRDTLRALRAPWRALFVGDGPLSPELRRWAKSEGDRVRVVSAVSHDEVPAYLAAMDILAAPSQTTETWREQFGRMIIEAFACGLVVVGSDSGEIPFTVGDAGIVVGESDREGWIAALGKALDDRALRRDLGERGLARARSQFAWAQVARRTLEFLDVVQPM